MLDLQGEESRRFASVQVCWAYVIPDGPGERQSLAVAPTKGVSAMAKGKDKVKKSDKAMVTKKERKEKQQKRREKKREKAE